MKTSRKRLFRNFLKTPIGKASLDMDQAVLNCEVMKLDAEIYATRKTFELERINQKQPSL